MMRNRPNRKSWGLIFTVILVLGVLTLRPVFAAPAQVRGVPTDANLKVAFIGDTAEGPDFQNVLNLIKNEGAAATVHMGDFDYLLDADGFFGMIDAVLGSNYPYFVAVGNHDAPSWPTGCGDSDGCYADFAIARLQRLGISPDDWNLNDQTYSITYRGLKLVFAGQETVGDAVYAPYLNGQLASDTHIWRVCAWHKNQQAMQIGGKTDEMGWGVYETCRQQGAIIATAHEHSYERTRTLINTQMQTVDPAWPDPNNLRIAPNSTFVFVSGLGGNSVRNQQRCLPTTFPYGCNGEWAKIYTSDQGAQFGALFITFNVGGDPYKAQGYFKTVSGQVIDQFTITAQPDWVPGPTPTPTHTSIPPTVTRTPSPAPGTATPSGPASERIVNGSFEVDANNNRVPDNWFFRAMAKGSGLVCDVAHDGICSVRLNGGTSREVYQRFKLAGKAGDTFVLSAWTRSENAGSAGTYRIRLTLYYNNGSYESFTTKLTAGTNDWWQMQRTVNARRSYYRVRVSLLYGELAGSVWFDQVSLMR